MGVTARIAVFFPILFGLSGCLGQANQMAGETEIPVPDPAYASDSVVGATCSGSDRERFCMGVKYVAYKDAYDNAVTTQDQALRNIATMNKLFDRCNIQFQIDKFLPINPEKFNLRYRTRSYTELDEIRETLGDDHTLLLVTTGPWDRTGSLGNTGANAWTALPGGGPYGAVIESSVATFAPIYSHEMGHYLNLLHVNDSNALMNAIIYLRSTNIYDTQCSASRRTIASYWRKMLR
jgi:hypothetical protein